jgi:hypothetical protein
LASTKRLLIAILIVVVAATPAEVAASSDDYQNLLRAVDYLRNTAYNLGLRLCREAPSAPKTHWIASDNLLAFKAFEQYEIGTLLVTSLPLRICGMVSGSEKGYILPYGEGQDHRDVPHCYATYKVGLLLYVSGKLEKPGHLPFEKNVTTKIWSMQNPDNGGIFTHIRADGSHRFSDTNTETTAFVILGMMTHNVT